MDGKKQRWGWEKNLVQEDRFFEFRFGNVEILNDALVTPSHFWMTSFSMEMTSSRVT